MEMDEEFLELNDLDWFSSYHDGFIAHFATGGRGIIPESVKKSITQYEVIYDFFYSIDKGIEVEVIDDNIPNFANNTQRDMYLKSFIEMASRGFFSHDVKNDGAYKLIAKPKNGLRYNDLPQDIKNILHVLPIEVLSSDTQIKIVE